MRDLLFLDANILIAAAYKENAGLARLWSMSEVALCSSGYALEEARRNLVNPARWARLDDLTAGLTVCNGRAALAPDIVLVEKDRPILEAAIHAHATHLLTLDEGDFGHLFGRAVGGVLILHPRGYWRLRNLPTSS